MLVGKGGRINGEINANNVVIEGDVEGKITSTEKVEIRDGGKYKGDMLARSILVSEKAVLEGNVKMKVEGEKASIQKFTEKRKSKRLNRKMSIYVIHRSKDGLVVED